MRPDPNTFQQLPVYGQTVAETWTAVEGILHQLESGTFYMPARLTDFMLRDDRVYGVLAIRVNGLLGSPIQITPADERSEATYVCDEIKELWPHMIPHSQAKEVLQSAIMMGWSFGGLEYDRTEKKWIPRLKAWHQQNSRYQWADNTYRTITADGGEQVIEQNTGRWFLYTPFGHNYAYLRGAMRALAKPWLVRTLTTQYWARFSEVHGMPVRAIEVPASADEAAQKRILREVNRMNSEATIRLPKMQDGTSFGLKLIEATATSYEGFEKQISECNREIAVVLLGQALSTEGSKGLGSHDKAGEEVRLDVKEADALMADDIRQQILEWYCLYNYGDKTLAPKCEYIVEPQEGTSQKAQELKTLADAFASFAMTGTPIDTAQILHRHGVPILQGAKMPDPTEIKLPKTEAQPAGDPKAA